MTEHEPTFHIGTILSVIHDKNLSPDGMDGVYQVLEYMTSEAALDQGDIAPAIHACAPLLRERYPELTAITPPTPEDIPNQKRLQRWLGRIATSHPPAERPVPKLTGYHPAVAHDTWLEAIRRAREAGEKS